ncbi:hypothetical protein P3S67_032365 [Capsicum chacoense]
MESSTNLVTVFLVCMIMLSSIVHVSIAQVQDNAEKFQEAFKQLAAEYKDCNNECQKTCSREGLGSTQCEMKCDTECTSTLLKERIQKIEKLF